MKNVLVICGPTSGGKTSLALSIAQKIGNTSIISADSRQAYQGLDIISGKDIPSNLPETIKMFGLDLFKPDQVANLSEYVNFARKKIDEELKLNRHVIVVGGTGLYLKGITENLSHISVPVNPILRTSLELLSVEELKTKLKSLDNEKFNKLNNSDLNNPRRLIRHIEISSNTDKIPDLHPVPKVRFYWVGIKISTDNLTESITKRVIERLNNGAVQEVKNLMTKYSNLELPIFSTLGVSEIISYLNHKLTKEELISIWSKNEVNYAKRQIVWFKKQPEIIWYDKPREICSLSSKLISYLQKND